MPRIAPFQPIIIGWNFAFKKTNGLLVVGNSSFGIWNGC
jgi:hypothetical protein